MMQRLRVLLAEDEEEVLLALADLVAGEPAFDLVGMARDTEDAIRLAATHRPDVAVLDVKMPGGGGRVAALGILEQSPATKVVALSAYEDRETVLGMLRAGAVGYLVKGASVDEIVRTIHASASGQGTLSPQVTAAVIAELSGKLRAENGGHTRGS